MTNFRGFAFNNSPAWLRAFFGERFIGLTEGLGADLLAEGATEAIKAPWRSISRALLAFLRRLI